MARVNLVIACWGGPRRTYDPSYEENPGYYLGLQMDSLTRFRHNLARITLVNNGGPPEYQWHLDQFRNKEYFKVIDRDNVGMSYGAFNAAWQDDRAFDYYIFLEDDYLFVLDNFDTKLVEIFESLPDCGYLCQLILDLNGAHPAIMNGMASRELLEQINILPGAETYNNLLVKYYGQVELEGQQAWGHAIKRTNKRLYDTGLYFKAPYVANYNEFLCWKENAPDYLIVPAQIYHSVLEDHNFLAQHKTTDQEWEQFKKYYYWLRNVYLSDEHRKTLEIIAAPFCVRTRDDLARVASVYERSIKDAQL